MVAGTIYPASIHCCWVLRWNLPELGEAAEVIEANDVAVLRGPAQAFDPPVITLLGHRLPVVERIAPALAGGAECVRRHTGDDFWLQILVQSIKFTSRPDIGAVVVHKDGNVAHYADGPLRTVKTEGTPLLVEKELDSTSAG